MLRRSALAALCRRPLRHHDGRRRCARRGRAVSRSARTRRRSARGVCAAGTIRDEATLFEHCVRAIDRGLTVGRARPAADGHRRLERRYESRRPGRARRERLARLVPVFRADRLRRHRQAPCARRPRRRYRAESRRLADALDLAWDGGWYRRAYFDDGTPLGSPRTTNAESTRSASRGRCCRAVRRRGGRNARWMRCGPPGAPPRADHSAPDTTVRQRRARSRLHQGVYPWHQRERRPVHARRAVDDHGARRARHTATRPSICST